MKWFKRKNKEIPETAQTADAAGPAMEAPKAAGDDAPAKKGFFRKLKDGLSKTRKSFAGRVDQLVSGKKQIDEDLLEELEEILITSDVGVETTAELIDRVRARVERKDLNKPEELKDALQGEMLAMFEAITPLRPAPHVGPHVIMVVGVNGVGKTTTIGKLAHRHISEGKKLLIVAGDTFRAAAVEQLEIWADRVGAQFIRHQGKSDPSAVVYDGIQAAQARNVDIVLIDTAGRLHTKVNLMEQLKKVRRTVGKLMPDGPHETLLVLDATTGQNAISQARLFHEAIGVTGIALAKLDGTAKGGVVIAICHSLGIPLQYVGLGEQIDDLEPFDPKAFVQALF